MGTKYIAILLALTVFLMFGCKESTRYGEKKMSTKKEAFVKTADGKNVDLYTCLLYTSDAADDRTVSIFLAHSAGNYFLIIHLWTFEE